MKQYNRIKAAHPDTILLFRVGDFYETFGSDAIVAAKVLGIILAKRGNGSAAEIELIALKKFKFKTRCHSFGSSFPIGTDFPEPTLHIKKSRDPISFKLFSITFLAS